MEHNTFPSGGARADLLDERVGEETRSRLVEHRATDECDPVVAVVEAQPDAEVLSSRFVRYARFLLLVAAAVLVAIVSTPMLQRQFQPSWPEMLARAAPSERRVPGRVAELPYTPRAKNHRTADAPKEETNLALLQAAAVLETRCRKDPSSENQHSLGVAYLLLNRWRDAVDAIETAVKTDSELSDISRAREKTSNASLLNDLSVAYYSYAYYGGKPVVYMEALESADLAYARRATSATAWNRAMAIEAVQVKSQAIDAWNDYLRLAKADPGRVEAEPHLRLLKQSEDLDRWGPDRLARLLEAADSGQRDAVSSIVERWPAEARRYGEEQLLGQWADGVSAHGATKGAQALHRAEEVGHALATASGERFLVDSVRAIRRTTPANRDVLMRAHAVFAQARRQYQAGDYAAARETFRRSARLFREAGSPYAISATIYEASSAYATHSYEDALALTTSVREVLSRHPDYYGACALNAWITGIAEASTGHPGIALGEYAKALRNFSHLGEDESVLAMQGMITTLRDYLGDEDGAWQLRFETLVRLNQAGDTAQRRPQILFSAGHAAAREGKSATALVFLSESARLAAQRGWNEVQAESLALESDIWRRRGQLAQARREATAALDAIHRVDNAKMRQGLLSNPDILGALLPVIAPQERDGLLSRAASFIERSNDHMWRSEVLRLRAELELGRANEKAAADAYRAAIDEIDLGRPYDSSYLDDTYLTRHQTLYDSYLPLAVKQRSAAESFELLSRSRARLLAEKLAPDASRATCTLSPDTVAIAFRSLDSELLVWSIRNGVVTQKSLPIPRQELSRLISTLRSSLADHARFDMTSSRLYEALFGGDLAGARFSQLVVLPDDILAAVPFAAIRNPRTSRYLIEDFRVVVAPSLAVFCSCSKRVRPMVASTESHALLIGVPESQGVDPLPWVRYEIRTLRQQYPRAVVLEEISATPARAVAALAQAAVVHFAGHARASRSDPRYSALLMADGESGSCELFAGRIADLSLSHTQVVVLNACDTAQYSARSTRAAASLAEAFLAAGVPNVIGTLWPIEDGASIGLTQSLHQELRAGLPPAEALRRVQQRMLRNSPPSVWACFEAIGGTA